MTATRTLHIRLFGWLLLSLSASAQFAPVSAKTPPRETQQTTCEEAEPTASFIRTGRQVASSDLSFFTSDLLANYKVLDNDIRNLNSLYLRCDRDWGATAYALALQAASKMPLTTLLINYDEAGRDWQQTAIRIHLLQGKRLEPRYSLSVRLNRQTEAWNDYLTAPQRRLRLID